MPRQQLAQLQFRSLEDLYDGKVAAVLQHHLQQICRDCMDRPGDANKRSVTLKFIALPILDQDGTADRAGVEIECFSKTPIHRTNPIPMKLTKNGFFFNQDLPDDLDQPSLFHDPKSKDD